MITSKNAWSAPVPTRRQLLSLGTLAIGSLALWPARSAAEEEKGVSHTEEAIHQEPTFTASPARVYTAITNTAQFDKVIQTSGVMQSEVMAKWKKPTDISHEVGGVFTLFGGYIVGRHLELVPDERIVQAWRVESWDRGVYSIVKFDLTKPDLTKPDPAKPEPNPGTKLVFDHTGFPKGDGEHLAWGWRAHYWDPIEKLLSQA